MSGGGPGAGGRAGPGGGGCPFTRAIAQSAALNGALERLAGAVVSEARDGAALRGLLGEIDALLDSPDLRGFRFSATHVQAVFTVVVQEEPGENLLLALCLAKKMDLAAGLFPGQIFALLRSLSRCRAALPGLAAELWKEAGGWFGRTAADVSAALQRLQRGATDSLSLLDWGPKDGLSLFCFFSEELASLPRTSSLMSALVSSGDAQVILADRVSSLASMIRASEEAAKSIVQTAKYLREGNLSDVVERSFRPRLRPSTLALEADLCYAMAIYPVREYHEAARDFVTATLGRVFDSLFTWFPLYGARPGAANTWLAAAKRAELSSRPRPAPAPGISEEALLAEELTRLLLNVHGLGDPGELWNSLLPGLVSCSVASSGRISPDKQIRALSFWLQVLGQALVFLKQLWSPGGPGRPGWGGRQAAGRREAVGRQVAAVLRVMARALALCSSSLTQAALPLYYSTANIVIILCAELSRDSVGRASRRGAGRDAGEGREDAVGAEVRGLCGEVTCRLLDLYDVDALYNTVTWLFGEFGATHQVLVHAVRNLLKQRTGAWLFKVLDGVRTNISLAEGLDRWGPWSERLDGFFEDVSTGRFADAIAFLGLPLTDGFAAMVDALLTSLQQKVLTSPLPNLAVLADILSLYVFNSNFGLLGTAKLSGVPALAEKLLEIADLLRGHAPAEPLVGGICNQIGDRAMAVLSALFPGVWIRKCGERRELMAMHGIPEVVPGLYERAAQTAGRGGAQAASGPDGGREQASPQEVRKSLKSIILAADIGELYTSRFGALSVPAAAHFLEKHKVPLAPLIERLVACMEGKSTSDLPVNTVLYTTTFALKLLGHSKVLGKSHDAAALSATALEFCTLTFTRLQGALGSLNSPAGDRLCGELLNLAASLLIAVYTSGAAASPNVNSRASGLVSSLGRCVQSRRHLTAGGGPDARGWDCFGEPDGPQVSFSCFSSWISAALALEKPGGRAEGEGDGKPDKRAKKLCKHLRGLAEQCAPCNAEGKLSTALAAFWDRPGEDEVGCAQLVAGTLMGPEERSAQASRMTALAFSAKVEGMMERISGAGVLGDPGPAKQAPHETPTAPRNLISGAPAATAIHSPRRLALALNYLLASAGRRGLPAGSAEAQLAQILCSLLYSVERSVPELARAFFAMHREGRLRVRLQDEIYRCLRRMVELLGPQAGPADAELVALSLREYRPRGDDDRLGLLLEFARRVRAGGRPGDAAALQGLCGGPRFARDVVRLGVLARSAGEVRQLLGLTGR